MKEEILGMEGKCDLIENTHRCTFDAKQNRIVLDANFPESHFQNCNLRISHLQEKPSRETITLRRFPLSYSDVEYKDKDKFKDMEECIQI